MKKNLLFLALAALPIVACSEKNGKDDDKPVKTFEATLTVETNLSSLVFAEPVDIVGAAVTSESLDAECTLVAAKKSGETYEVVGEAQTGKVDAGKVTAQFFTDSKEMTDIKVTLTANGGTAAKDFYFHVAKVTGELKGHVYMNDAAKLVADGLVKTHQSAPTEYPEEHTGAGSDTKSFFCQHGVVINGKREHILSLSELRPLDGLNSSCAFVNVAANTAKDNEFGVKLPKQAGYAFFTVNNMGGGTVNRQCDLYEVDGHKMQNKTDKTFRMRRVRGSWAGEGYHADLFEFVDKLFLELKSAQTPLQEMKAFWKLSEIQKKLDSSTIPDFEGEPTSIDWSTYVRKLQNAGDKATAIQESLRAGDYILYRSQRGTVDNPVYYYGIMQILQFPDDKIAFTNPENVVDYATTTERMDPKKVLDLAHKPVYLSIKGQFEVPAE